jgi:Rod binding domain-containing protein
MSAIDPTQLPIDTAQMPASVRNAGAKAEQLYATALQFEQLLVEQLTQQLDLTGGAGGSDGSSSDATTSLFAQMLPNALAQGVTGAGGLGLAGELYNSLATQAGLPAATPTQTQTQTQAAAAPATAPASPTSSSPAP